MECLIILFIVLVNHYVNSSKVQQIPLNRNHLNKKMDGHRLFSKSVPNLSYCVYDCMVTTRCQSFNFYRDSNVCEFNYATSTTAPESIVPSLRERILFSDISVWPKSMSKDCEDVTCDSEQRCLPGDPPTCLSIRDRPLVCPAGWYTFNKICYLFVNEWMNWTAAKENCRTKGGYLAIVPDQDTETFLLDIMERQKTLKEKCVTWLGASVVDGHWVWAKTNESVMYHGSSFEYITRPDCCLYLYLYQRHFIWDGEWCEYKYQSICQRNQ